jgi:SAM (Sterile alpha motif) domain-containing protein
MQIAEWLEKLGLGQYAERFVQNGVDMGVLPELMDEDFDKLGVLLGHRRKMLRAIADLDPATSPSCFAIWSARLHSRRVSIPRICGK